MYEIVFYRAFDSGVLLEAVAAEDRPMFMPPEDGTAAATTSSAAVRLRQHFPETWLWHNQWTESVLFLDCLHLENFRLGFWFCFVCFFPALVVILRIVDARLTLKT